MLLDMWLLVASGGDFIKANGPVQCQHLKNYNICLLVVNMLFALQE